MILAGVISAFIFATPATAVWEKTMDGFMVDRFVARGKTIWAVPELTSSTDAGRTWGGGRSFGDRFNSDADVSRDGMVADIYDKVGLRVHWADYRSNIERPAETPAMQAVRFLGDSLIGVGQCEDCDYLSIFRSTDLARTWASIVPDDIGYSVIPFVLDDAHAWIMSDLHFHPFLWKTSDGGKTWEKSDSPWGGSPESIFFLDKRRGWVVWSQKDGMQVAGTEDGGKSLKLLSWLEVSTPPEAGHSMQPWVLVSTESVESLVFADKKRGWAASVVSHN